jgi:hypothetical protein
MHPRFKHKAIALLLAPAMALPAGALYAQQQKQEAAAGATSQQDAGKPSAQAVIKMTESWPNSARHAARQMIDKYGPPAEATPTRIVWFNNGPWKRTVVLNEEFDHDFPIPHKDVMEQTINLEVPPDKFDELAAFDGSVYVDRTRGEISARCDMEAANLIALNLAQDIITGKRSVEEARQAYPKMVMAFMQKEQTPYAEKLTFTPPDKAGFSDQPVVSAEMIKKAQQMKQAMIKQDRQKGGVADQPGGGKSAAGASREQKKGD